MSSATPISIAAHSRRFSYSLASAAFAPWQSSMVNKATPCPPRTSTEEATAQIQVSPSSFSFQVGSPSAHDIVSASLRARGVYDATKLEQEHCTGYECCNVKLGDMHAVMDHFEVAHRQSRLGHIPAPPVIPRMQVFRQQPILPPVLLPVLPARAVIDDYDISSAPSPCPSSDTDRSGSRGSFSEDTEFQVDLDFDTARLPQTPPAGMHHTGQHVTIVGAPGEFNSPDGFSNSMGFNQYNGFAQPIQSGQGAFGVQMGQTQYQKQQQQPSGTFIPVVQVAVPSPFQQQQQQQQPNFAATTYGGQNFASPLQPIHNQSEMRPVIHVQVSTPSNIDTSLDFAETPDTPSFGGDFTPTTAAPSPVSPFYANGPQYLQTPQQPQMRAPVTSGDHPFHHPQPQAGFNPRLQLDAHRPLAPSPSPTLASNQSQIDFYAQRSQNMARSDSNASSTASVTASMATLNQQQQQPQMIAPPSLYATSVKRSYDEMDNGSASNEQQEYDDYDEDDEDAEGEMEVTMVSHYPSMPTSNASTPRRPSASGHRDKKSKSGRPRTSTGRASAQKDPKRAKLFCPKEGCTKRYMNPNGLKYHLEKGTCTFES